MVQRVPADKDAVGVSLDRHRSWRLWPFWLVAVCGQVSAAIPSGPAHAEAFLISACLLAAAAVAGMAPRVPGHVAWTAWGLVYIASVACLMMAAGGLGSGLGALLLLPAVGVSLYGRPLESALMVCGAVCALLVLSLVNVQLADAVVRRMFLMGTMAATISVAIHTLRNRLSSSNQRTEDLLHQARSINAAARTLSTLLTPDAIAAAGVGLAADIAHAPRAPAPRCSYLRIVEGVAITEDATSAPRTDTFCPFPVELEPALALALSTRQPQRCSGAVERLWVPVCPEGSLHGVLSVASELPILEDRFERLTALGHLLELGLSNWSAHERLEQQATAEERRRIARDLHDGLAHELAFIASRSRNLGRSDADDPSGRELAHAADRALDEARRAITVLSAVGPQPISAAFVQTAEDLGARFGVPVLTEVADNLELPGEVTENLLRILREALTNAATHARPSRLLVRLDNRDGVQLTVSDDGCAFDPGNVGSGFGLVSMRERATSIGASLEIVSSPGEGTQVRVSWP